MGLGELQVFYFSFGKLGKGQYCQIFEFKVQCLCLLYLVQCLIQSRFSIKVYGKIKNSGFQFEVWNFILNRGFFFFEVGMVFLGLINECKFSIIKSKEEEGDWSGQGQSRKVVQGWKDLRGGWVVWKLRGGGDRWEKIWRWGDGMRDSKEIVWLGGVFF